MRSPFVLSLALLVFSAFAGATSASSFESFFTLEARLHEAQKALSTATALIERAKTYPPSRVTSHKQAVFAYRAQSWQAVVNDCEQKLAAYKAGTAAPASSAGSSIKAPAALVKTSSSAPTPAAVMTTTSAKVVAQAMPTTTSQLWITSVRKSTSAAAVATLPVTTSSATTSSTTTTRATTTSVVKTTAAATSSAPPTMTLSSKRGVGYNDAALTKNLNLAWAYNWDQVPAGTLNPGVEFVPMLWGPLHASTWAANAKKALDSGSSHLLAFNEPDLNTQADMTVAESVIAWKQYMSPFVGQAKLGSMAVTNGGAPMGPAYIKAFFDACPECEAEVDFVALHWYDSAENFAYFKNFLGDAYTLLNKPIWLTEFAGSGSVAEQITFLQEVISWMNEPAQSYIQRFAGFGDFVGTYVNADGSLTPLGQAYSSAS